MSWLTAIGTALVGFLSALPKIIDEFTNWRKSQETAHQEEIAKQADAAVKETQDATTDEQRRKVASKWTSIIKSFRK
jgi:hypothetical protein